MSAVIYEFVFPSIANLERTPSSYMQMKASYRQMYLYRQMYPSLVTPGMDWAVNSFHPTD